MIINQDILEKYAAYLYCEEKSDATREKYLRDVNAFSLYIGNEEVTKEIVVEWKRHLVEAQYAVRSINSMLASVNSFLRYMGKDEYKVKNLRLQKSAYLEEEKELSKADYLKLIQAAKGKKQLQLILQTICGTGIRVSELKYFTVEGIKRGTLVIVCKNKTRTILIPGKLKTLLLRYAKEKQIKTGAVFITRSGKSVNRSNIWAAMKKLCQEANVKPSKVFPHNLRKLFARTFYAIEKDIAKLADIIEDTILTFHPAYF